MNTKALPADKRHTPQAAAAAIARMIAILRAEDENQPLLTAEGDIDLETLAGYAGIADYDDALELAEQAVASYEHGW